LIDLLRPAPGKTQSAGTSAATAAATVAATFAADYKDKIAALTLTITGMKEKTLYFSSSDLIFALFLSFCSLFFLLFFSLFQSHFAFLLSLVLCRSSSVVLQSNATLL
jgi:hypothetical protein